MKSIKKIIFITVAWLCIDSLQVHAQEREAVANQKSYVTDGRSLLQKSKNQKITAFILLGAGAGFALIGSNIASNANINNIGTGIILMGTGGAAVITSVPFFIASGKNKRKANLILKDQKVFFNPGLNINEHVVSVGLQIKL